MRKPTIGLCLPSGGAKGISYIGVLKVFEKHGIKVSRISGSSIGAIIGSLYASGFNAKDLEKIAKETDYVDLMDLTSLHTGLMSGEKAEKKIRELINDKRFKDLQIPLSIIATDINSGKRVIFEKGDVTQAVRASMAIPGVFNPVIVGKYTLVDGGVIDPMPLKVLEQHKVDKIIVIDISTEIKELNKIIAPKARSPFMKRVQKKIIELEIQNFRDYLKSNQLLPFGLDNLLKFFIKPKLILRFLKKPKSIPKIFAIPSQSIDIMINQLEKLTLELSKPDVVIDVNTNGIGEWDFDKIDHLIKLGENAANAKLKEIKKITKVK
ncbi:MAG: patatin-like phospholipase family protein [archaeon]